MGLRVELFTNDLSIHGQFYDVSTFDTALNRIMDIRRTAQRYGRELYCHRNFANVQVTPQMRLPQAIQNLAIDKRRSVMQWITRHGPFWEDERLHGEDDWLEWEGNVVTDTAVGETAYRCLNSTETSLVSLIPSSWDFSPAVVKWRKSDEEAQAVEVVNYRNANALETALRAAPAQIASWEMLADMARARCLQLAFSSDCFDPLQAYPFAHGAAQHILNRLDKLDQLKTCFDADGRRTAEGHRLYQRHFAGDRAWFSDSSATEKAQFKTQLTFRHPTTEGQSLFCPWHGKVNHHPLLRIHFSWPVTANEPLYVVYVGPKITQR